MPTPNPRASPHPFSLHLVMKRRRPGLVEPCRHIRLHQWNVRVCNVPSNLRQRSETWLFPICSYIPRCQTRWQPPAMPSGHCETICQRVWLSAWRMAEGWKRTRRTLASLRVHPPSGYVRRMILMMNHPYLMLFVHRRGFAACWRVVGHHAATVQKTLQKMQRFCGPVAPSWQKVQ